LVLVSCTSSSNAADARNDCPDGTLIGGIYDEIVISSFQSCTILGVTVLAGVQIEDANEITIMNSQLQESVTISNTENADILGNVVVVGNIETTGNARVTIMENLLQIGSIESTGNDDISVMQNAVNQGSIQVQDDVGLRQQNALVMYNTVLGGGLTVNDNKNGLGNITCNNNIRLDSSLNEAKGGIVACSDD
jgi:hypothetical protein